MKMIHMVAYMSLEERALAKTVVDLLKLDENDTLEMATVFDIIKLVQRRIGESNGYSK